MTNHSTLLFLLFPIFTAIKTTIIYPATDKHIEKYSAQEIRILQETPALYQSVTLPYLTDHQFSLDVSENFISFYFLCSVSHNFKLLSSKDTTARNEDLDLIVHNDWS